MAFEQNQIVYHKTSRKAFRVEGETWKDRLGRERIVGYSQRNGTDYGKMHRLLVDNLRACSCGDSHCETCYPPVAS